LPAHPLAIWESFYVIVGSSAAALTGLQFIVVAFIADRRAHISPRTLSAFATPAIIHYSVVLFVAAALSAPWLRVTMVIAPLAAVGVFGFAFTGRVVHKMRSPREYEPVLEDWVWHAVLPLLAYGALFVPALILNLETTISLFVIAGASLLLLYIGIHAAWDTVTYIATEQDQPARRSEPAASDQMPSSS
jgi:hypothetical protein